jgi:hypothetical protein
MISGLSGSHFFRNRPNLGFYSVLWLFLWIWNLGFRGTIYQYRIHFAAKHFATPVNLDSRDDALLGQKTSARTEKQGRLSKHFRSTPANSTLSATHFGDSTAIGKTVKSRIFPTRSTDWEGETLPIYRAWSPYAVRIAPLPTVGLAGLSPKTHYPIDDSAVSACFNPQKTPRNINQWCPYPIPAYPIILLGE